MKKSQKHSPSKVRKSSSNYTWITHCAENKSVIFCKLFSVVAVLSYFIFIYILLYLHFHFFIFSFFFFCRPIKIIHLSQPIKVHGTWTLQTSRRFQDLTIYKNLKKRILEMYGFCCLYVCKNHLAIFSYHDITCYACVCVTILYCIFSFFTPLLNVLSLTMNGT